VAEPPIEEKEGVMSLVKAVVVGVGAEDGLGAAISRCYAANNRHVLVAGRTSGRCQTGTCGSMRFS
jgi:NADP-dependent 3-hydroxy acid dehydrogenase YdfG